MAEFSASLDKTVQPRASQRPWLRDFPLRNALAESAAVLFLIPVLLSVALWNGFPLTFYDTGAYLLEGLGNHFLLERSPGYSLFLRFSGGSFSLWMIVGIQASMTAFVMTEMARILAPRIGLFQFLGIAALLIFLTGLAWYVGELEPDCLTALVPLSLYLITFHARRLGTVRTGSLFLISTFAAFAHTANFALAFWLIIFFGLIRAYRIIRRPKIDADVKPSLLLPAASVVLALILIVTANAIFTGRLFVSRAAPAFVFARVLQDGIIERLLDDTCPRSGYNLCADRGRLPETADAWLWNKASPFNRLGRFPGAENELGRMVHDSLARYPLLHATAAAKDTVEQFFSFRTGDQIESQRWVLDRDFTRFIPKQKAEYDSARQQRIAFDFVALNLVHVPVGWLSLIGLFALIVVGTSKMRRDHFTLLLVVAMALLGNAIICGVFSNPHDRYQSRLIWLLTFVLLLIAADWKTARLWTKGESGT